MYLNLARLASISVEMLFVAVTFTNGTHAYLCCWLMGCHHDIMFPWINDRISMYTGQGHFRLNQEQKKISWIRSYPAKWIQHFYQYRIAQLQALNQQIFFAIHIEKACNKIFRFSSFIYWYNNAVYINQRQNQVLITWSSQCFPYKLQYSPYDVHMYLLPLFTHMLKLFHSIARVMILL